MTRIITITSGLAQVGKTHLAVNLALELVRRGHRVGLYHELQGATPVDGLLELQQALPPRRRVTDRVSTDKVIRRGYLGMDILACELPLRQLPQLPADQLEHCIASMDTEDGYDDFLIDTSGMEPHALLACCAASALVVLVVTPDPHSQAEAFALFRVLQLNGFDGELQLLVNRVPTMVAAGEIRQRLGSQVQQHLGVELPLLGMLAEDRHVDLAQQSRQAFSTLFPDSEAAACVVLLADALDEFPAVAGATQAEFWSDFLERVQAPVVLAGDIQLETLAAAGGLPEQLPDAVTPEPGGGMGLLYFDGDLRGLCAVLEQAPLSLHTLAADISGFAACLADAEVTALERGGIAAQAENDALPGMAATLLRAAGADDSAAPQIQLQVDECRVSGAERAWLRTGRYLRFIFRVSGEGALPEPLQALLARVPETGQDTGTPGEQVWEIMSHAHNGCLHVIATPGAGVRIQVWLPADEIPARANTDPVRTAADGAASKRLH